MRSIWRSCWRRGGRVSNGGDRRQRQHRRHPRSADAAGELGAVSVSAPPYIDIDIPLSDVDFLPAEKGSLVKSGEAEEGPRIPPTTRLPPVTSSISAPSLTPTRAGYIELRTLAPKIGAAKFSQVCWWRGLAKSNPPVTSARAATGGWWGAREFSRRADGDLTCEKSASCIHSKQGPCNLGLEFVGGELYWYANGWAIDP